MATNIQNKLYHLEVPPPPDVWPEIAVRLNAEFNAEEVPAAQKMYNLSVPPPAAAWQHIEAALDQQPAKKETRVLRLPVFKAAGAAAAMILVTMAAWYFLNNSSDHSKANATVVKQSSNAATADNNTHVQKQTPSASFERDEPMADKFDDQSIASADGPAGGIADSYTSRPESHRIAWYSDYKPIATSYAGVDDVQAIPLTNASEPTVEAPLIRDANGKIILDKKLITSPDNCYINITGPNGDQTRISSKFLHIISSLNDDDAPEDYFDFMLQENSLWKLRFKEWKDKFLNQEIIPTATSFDILELKDILQDEN